jgi:hypothetical protein
MVRKVSVVYYKEVYYKEGEAKKNYLKSYTVINKKKPKSQLFPKPNQTKDRINKIVFKFIKYNIHLVYFNDFGCIKKSIVIIHVYVLIILINFFLFEKSSLFCAARKNS